MLSAQQTNKVLKDKWAKNDGALCYNQSADKAGMQLLRMKLNEVSRQHN